MASLDGFIVSSKVSHTPKSSICRKTLSLQFVSKNHNMGQLVLFSSTTTIKNEQKVYLTFLQQSCLTGLARL